MRHKLISRLSIVAVACSAGSAVAQVTVVDRLSKGGQQYEATALPTFPAFPVGYVSAINNSRHVAGTNYACPFTLSCFSRTYLFDGRRFIHTSQEMIAAVPPGFFGLPYALDLNDADEALIRLAVPDMGGYSYYWHAGETVLISADPDADPNAGGPLVPFPPPPGVVWQINDNGVVVGSVQFSAGSPTQAFLWTRDEGVTVLIDPPPGFLGISARGINNHNQVVGAAAGAVTRGFSWINGKFTILPPLPGDIESQALRVNDNGFIVGTSLAPTPGNHVRHLVMWHDGVIVDSVSLDLPGGIMMDPTSINAANEVVGSYWPTALSIFPIGFRWTAGGDFEDLDGSIKALPDLNVRSADGVNDAGQIVVLGEFPDHTGGGFILTPVPNTPGDLDGNGDVDGIDLALLLGQWTGPARYSPCPPHRPADLNQDCKVNGLDIAMLLSAWG